MVLVVPPPDKHLLSAITSWMSYPAGTSLAAL